MGEEGLNDRGSHVRGDANGTEDHDVLCYTTAGQSRVVGAKDRGGEVWRI